MQTLTYAEATIERATIALGRYWPAILFGVALVLGLSTRFMLGWPLPFWFDEAFSGTIASQPDPANLMRWCLGELGGPAFYMPLWAWAKLAGISDTALRLPSAAMTIATPLLLAWRGHADRRLALLWGAVVLLWLPGVPDAIEARGYAQLLLLGSVQAVFFLLMARRPERRSAFAWSTVSALAILTHYYAVLPTALQGLALVTIHRRRLLACWPALSPFGITAAWLAVHLPFLLDFGGHQVAAYPPLPRTLIAVIPMMIFGAGLQGYVVLLAVAGSWRPTRERDPVAASAECWLAATGVATCAVVIALGFVAKAAFAARYMTPAVPSGLFALALWLRTRPTRQWHYAGIAIAALVVPMATALVRGSDDHRFVERHGFSTEQASTWLMKRHPQRLVFAWTGPSGEASDSGRLGEVAGFFFARADQPVAVSVARPDGDPNTDLIAAADTDKAGAILWVADLPPPGGWHPAIARLADGWQCRDFGNAVALVYACRR